jgi:hypothetical protein
LTEEWRHVHLVCPECRQVVTVTLDDLPNHRTIRCDQQHLLPTVDLRQSGLQGVTSWLDAIAGSIVAPPANDHPSEDGADK